MRNIVFFLLCVGCQTDIDSKLLRNYSIIKSHSIPIPASVNDYSTNMKLDRFDPNKLYIEERDRGIIHVIDLKQKAYEYSIEFPKEGPNSLKTTSRGFLQLTRDSFVLASKGVPYFYFGLLDGSIKESYKYDNLNIGNFVFYFTSFGTDPFLIDNKKWIFPMNLMAGSLSDSQKKERVLDHSLLVEYDFKLDKFEKMPIYLPNDYFDDDLNKTTGVSFVYDAHSSIGYLSFNFHNAVYKINFANNSYDIREINGSHFVPYNEIHRTTTDYLADLVLRPLNIMLLNDPYRKVLYRLDKHNMFDKYDSSKNYSFEDVLYNTIFSIIILDYDLNKIGEVFIDDQFKYVARNTFVGHDGLYLSKNNPIHSDYKEDILEFDVIQFQ